MTDQGIVVLGIPIPSSSPVFLSIVAVHVAAGLNYHIYPGTAWVVISFGVAQDRRGS
jgi:hypothetical protein